MGKEFGSVTGRPRRCGWFDAAAMKRSVMLNGISGLCMTKLDVLDGLDVLQIGVGYRYKGKFLDVLPYGAQAEIGRASCRESVSDTRVAVVIEKITKE